MSETFLHLQASETSVATVAATIFAAYIQTGEITSASEDEFVRKSLSIALKLVQGAEAAIKSDEEWVRPDSKSKPVL